MAEWGQMGNKVAPLGFSRIRIGAHSACPDVHREGFMMRHRLTWLWSLRSLVCKLEAGGAWGHSSSANAKSWKAGALALGQKMVSAGAERVNFPAFPFLSLSGPQWVGWRPPALGRVVFTVYRLRCWHLPETASQTHASVRFYQLFGPPLARQADP